MAGSDDIASDDIVTSAETLPSGDEPSGSEQLPRGAAVGRYAILGVLGAGAMGVVYAARDAALDRKIAIKLLRGAIDDGRLRMQREAQAMARLSHPNVIAVHDVGTHDGHVFVAMELVDGQTLRQWLAASPRSWRAVRDVFVAAGRGLAAAHGAELIHRDFKPDNVLIDRDGRVRVGDFGLARGAEAVVVDARRAEAKPLDVMLTQTGALLGTPAYMAPEQLLGDPADARSDQFSFCVALYEALYGARPFAGETLAMLAASIDRGAIRPAARDARVPAWLRATVVRGLAADPARRHPSMDALLAQLAREPVRRRWIAAGAIAVVAIAGALGVAATRGRGEQLACASAADRLAGVWDAAARAGVEQRFAALVEPAIATTWPAVARDLDAYAARWGTQWDAACRAPDRDTDPLLHAQRLACLENALLELRGSIAGMSADAARFAEAFTGQLEHASLHDCERIEVLRAQLPAPPPDRRAAVTAKLLELDQVLAELHAELAAYHDYQRFDETLARLASVGGELEAMGSPAAATAANWQAYFAIADLTVDVAKRRAAARAALDLALRRGEAMRDDAALAWTHRLAADLELADAQGDLAQASAELERAEIAAKRVGNPETVTLDIMMTRARLDARHGRFADAERLAREIAPRWTAANALSSFELGHAADPAPRPMLARALVELGRDAEALAVLQGALAAQVAALGPDHWSLDELHVQLAIFEQRTDPAAALAELDRISKRLGAAREKQLGPQVGILRLVIAGRLGDPAAIGAAEDALARYVPHDPWESLGDHLIELGGIEAAAHVLTRTGANEHADVVRALLAMQRGDGVAMRDLLARHPAAATGPDVLATLRGIAAALTGDRKTAEHILAGQPRDLAATRPREAINATLILVALGRWQAARAQLETARAVPGVWMRGRTTELAETDAWLGAARLETGDAQGALVPLEEALEQTDAIAYGFAYYSPVAELALARALWETGGDRARARRLAERARRDALRLGPGRDRERLAAIAWLAAH